MFRQLPIRLLVAFVALGATAPLSGCAASSQLGQRGHRAEGPVVPVDVKDEAFASSVHKLLRDGTERPERLSLLVGVVRRQLTHAATRFASGHDQRATDSVIGALYLVRSGEGRGEMIDATGERALAGAIERVSPRGDEGRAQVLMMMRKAALPASSHARHELDDHLMALDRWLRDTHKGGAMERLGSEERFAVARALIDPSPQALTAAGDAVGAWIDRAIEYNFQFRQTGQRPDRDEAIEAARALETGAATMAAIYLRHGDAKGALDRINRSGARRVIRPAFYERIRNAATNDDALAWQALAEAYARQGLSDEEDDDSSLDSEIIEAGLWGTVLEAYRRDATKPEPAMLLARSLVRLGLSEAAPLVLADALGQHPSPALLSAVLAIVRAGMTEEAAIEDLGAARRTFTAASSLLAWADRPELKGRIDPSPARLRFLMASVELRAGNLAAARPLLEQAATAEPTVSLYTSLAMVERQAGNLQAALTDVGRALSAPDAARSVLDVAEAQVLAFELQRDSGDTTRAKTALDAALARVLAARQQRGDPATRARAERVLGRILDGYGETKGAVRALDRALQAAGEDRPTLGATMLDAVGRAFVRRDLAAARAALKRGLEGDAPDEDLTYGGLWLLLLERQLHVKSDGIAERALRAGGANHASWTSKLAAWASGKISDNDLATAAQNTSQRVEADFYTALAHEAAGDPAARDRLRAVAKSPIIDLLEVQLAREIVAPPVRAQLPGNVAIP